MALTKITAKSVKDDAITTEQIAHSTITNTNLADDSCTQAKIADEAVDEARLQISNAGSNGQFLQKQSGNTGGLTWAAANEYTHPNHSGEVTSTADGAQVIADNVVDEANLKVSNSPTNGQLLSAQSGNTGGLTWTDPPASAPQLEATASGAITAGDRVIINANGTVTKAAINVTPNNETQITASLTSTTSTTASVMSGQWDQFFFGYDTQYGMPLLGTSSIGGSHEYKLRTISYSGQFPVLSSVLFNFNSGQRIWEIGGIVEDPNQNKHICFYSTNNDYSNPYCKGAVITMTSATAGSAGTAVNFSASGDYFSPGGCFDSNVNKFITTYTTSTGVLKARACYIDGTSITTHTEVSVHDGTGRSSSDKARLVFDSTNNKTVCIYSVGATLKAKVITCASNGTLTLGSEVALTSSGDFPQVDFSPDDGKIAVAYRKPSNGYRVICGTVSGTSISFGSEFDFAGITTNDTTVRVKYSEGSKKFIVMWRDDNDKLKGEVLTLSGTTFSEHADIISPEGAGHGLSVNQAIRSDHKNFDFIYDPTKKRVAYIYSNDGNTGPYYTQSIEDGVSATNLTEENYIGIAAASASDSATATIDISGAVNSNQSSLTAGQKYYVQNNGSLGLTAATPKVFAGTAVSATKLIVNDQQPMPTSAWTLLDSGTKTTSGQAVIGGSANFIAASCSAYNWFELHWCYHGTAQTHVGFNTSFNGSSWQTNSDNVIYMDGSHVATDSTTDDNNKRSGDSGDPRLTDAYNSMQNYHGVTTFSFPHDTTRYKMMITRFGGWNSTMAQYNIRMITGTAIHGNRGSTGALTGLAIWNNSGYGNPVSWRLLGGT